MRTIRTNNCATESKIYRSLHELFAINYYLADARREKLIG